MSAAPDGAISKKRLRLVVIASTAGTAFEGYDYFIFGALAAILSRQFFSGVDETTAFIFALLTFAVGFVTRPLGAIVFGRLGDERGRKGVFLVTISLMGGATLAIGLLPTYDQAGVIAPILLLCCRLLQGFALGGEYGGAVIYVAEHSSPKARGFNTGWIQATGAFGLISALSVILVTRTAMGEPAFEAWGWRLPFLLSAVLLVASIWIRTRLGESPVFEDMRARGLKSRAPLAETFFDWRHARRVLLALFGMMAATGVMFYAGQFYAQFFLERIAKVEPATVNALIVTSTIVSAPLFVLFGLLSDRVGRKPVMLFGMGLMLALYFPAFHVLSAAANPALAEAQRAAPIVVAADRAACTVQFDPIGTARVTASCDVARRALRDAGVAYRFEPAAPGAPAEIRVGDAAPIISFDAGDIDGAAFDLRYAELTEALQVRLDEAGYPRAADPERVNHALIITVLIGFVTAIAALSGPQAATLAELFPARVRYTAVSLPYHVGLGWFGGFMPAIAFATIAATGNVYSGLWYPFAVTAMAFTIALFFLPETRGRPLGAAASAGDGAPS